MARGLASAACATDEESPIVVGGPPRTQVSQAPIVPGDNPNAIKEAREKYKATVRAYEAVAALEPKSEDAKVWAIKVAAAKEEMVQNTPAAEKRKQAQGALAKIDKAIKKAFAEGAAAEKAMGIAFEKFYEAQARRDAIILEGSGLEAERKVLQRQCTELGGEGLPGSVYVPNSFFSFDWLEASGPETRSVAASCLQALAGLAAMEKAAAAGEKEVAQSISLGGAALLAAAAAFAGGVNDKRDPMREGDKWTNSSGVQMYVSSEGNFSLAGTGVEDEADMPELDSDGESAGSIGSGGSRQKTKQRRISKPSAGTLVKGLPKQKTSVVKPGQGATIKSLVLAKLYKAGDSSFEDLARGSPAAARETGNLNRGATGPAKGLRCSQFLVGGGRQTSAEELATGEIRGEGAAGSERGQGEGKGHGSAARTGEQEGEAAAGRGGEGAAADAADREL